MTRRLNVHPVNQTWGTGLRTLWTCSNELGVSNLLGLPGGVQVVAGSAIPGRFEGERMGKRFHTEEATFLLGDWLDGFGRTSG